ncbi:MAG: SPOR domain-containing protein [Muribaculaceae bacterium]|nr:SPOR domain-containing protein [Muribaculaceae bacterium]
MGTAQAQSPASLPSYDQSGAMSEEADGSRPDSVNNLTIVQPSALANRIERARQTAGGTQSESADTDDSAASQQTGERQRINGFRIQVFSDNNQKTSQREAKAKERRLNERFPEYETYIVYNSPYWRLKVGDFRTEFDAEAAADEIKRAFPEFAREVRIVRDRISTGR